MNKVNHTFNIYILRYIYIHRSFDTILVIIINYNSVFSFATGESFYSICVVASTTSDPATWKNL